MPSAAFLNIPEDNKGLTQFLPLLQEAWEKMAGLRSQGIPILGSSIPVLFFGHATTAKVATVGINPSSREFVTGKGDPLSLPRFFIPSTPCNGNPLQEIEAISTVQSMFAYFDTHPYKWFDGPTAFLDSMGTSFINGTAVHTDIASPYATCEPWGQLSHDQQETLEEHGFDLWKRTISKIPNLQAIVGMGKRWRSLPIDFDNIPLSTILGTTTPNALSPIKHGHWIVDGRDITVYWWSNFWNRAVSRQLPLLDLYRTVAAWLTRHHPCSLSSNSTQSMSANNNLPDRTPCTGYTSSNELAAAFVDHFRKRPENPFLSGSTRRASIWDRATITIDEEHIAVCIKADTTRDAALKFAAAVLRGSPPLAVGRTVGGTRKILVGDTDNSRGLFIYEI